MIQRHGKYIHPQSDGMQSSAYFLTHETEFCQHGQLMYEKALGKVEAMKVEGGEGDMPLPPSASKETEELKQKLDSLQSSFLGASSKRAQMEEKLTELDVLSQNVDALTNEMVLTKIEADDDLIFARREHERVCSSLQRLMHINVHNDAFHIWFAGPFATINGLRLGRLPFVQPIVEWSEINAALGHTVLAVDTLAKRLAELDFAFQKFTVMPLGSASRIRKVEDKDASGALNLFTDGNFGYFTGKRGFNNALVAFLSCVDELGSFVSSRDPTVPVPHAITEGGTKINGLPIALSNDYEAWTKALKFLLTNIKWIIAWCSKHTRR